MFEAKCPKCGKNHITAPFHIYHSEKGFYCSWTCYNHRNDDAPPKKKKARMVEQCTTTGSVIETFKTAVHAATHIDGGVNAIRNACKHHTLYKGFLWRYKNDVS